MDDFLLIAETVVNSGVEVFEFGKLIDIGLVSKGLVGLLRNGDFERVFEVLSCAKKLGISVLELFKGNAYEDLWKECRLVVERGDVEAVVEFLEMLSGIILCFSEI